MSARPRIPLLIGACLLIASLILSALPGQTVNAQSAQLTFKPNADAYVDQAYPGANYGTQTTLRVDADTLKRTYLRFTVSGLNGGIIQSAKIRMYASVSNSSGYIVNAESNNTWAESTLSFNNAPAVGTKIATSPAINAGQWVEADVSSYVKAEGTYNFVLTTASTVNTSLASRESGANAPQLVVTAATASPTATATKASVIDPGATTVPTAAPTSTTVPTAAPTATKVPTIAPTATTVPTIAPTTPPLPTGSVYYVSTSGNDNNPGTASAPFRTLNKGISVLKAGATLYVRSGTYLINHSLIVSQSGTASSPITITTAPGEPSLAILSGDLNGNKIADAPGGGDAPVDPDYYFIRLSGSYIHFQNFEIAFSSRKGIVSNGSYNVMSGNNVHNTYSAGIWVHGPNNTVENNVIWRVDESNNCAPSTNPYSSGLGANRLCNGNWPGALAWGDTSGTWNPAPNAIIRHNVVFHSSGEGLLCMNTDGAVVEDNILYDNWGLGIDEDQCGYTLIQRNLIVYSADKTWWRDSNNPAHGIMLSNEERLLVGWPGEHDNKVINNIIIGSNLRYWGQVAGSALKNDLIANNTIIESQNIAPLDIDAPTSGATHTNTRFTNNLIMDSSGTMSSVDTLVGLTFDHNLWSRNNGIVAGAGDVIGDPRLANATAQPCTLQITHPDAAHPLYEYHKLSCVSPDGVKLTSGSPAIDKGANLLNSGVTNDYFKIARPQGAAFDIGANE